jgi:CheY-like chemotaxis protein
MNDFLTKPLDPAALRAVLARATDGRLLTGWTKADGGIKLAS